MLTHCGNWQESLWRRLSSAANAISDVRILTVGIVTSIVLLGGVICFAQAGPRRGRMRKPNQVTLLFGLLINCITGVSPGGHPMIEVFNRRNSIMRLQDRGPNTRERDGRNASKHSSHLGTQQATPWSNWHEQDPNDLVQRASADAVANALPMVAKVV